MKKLLAVLLFLEAGHLARFAFLGAPASAPCCGQRQFAKLRTA